jgi:hypothetical protein
VPVAVLIDIPGCTAAQYEGVVRQVGLAQPDARRPPGMLIHVAGPSADGWRVFDVWSDRESYERFARERIAPALAAWNVPPFTPQVIDVENLVT